MDKISKYFLQISKKIKEKETYCEDEIIDLEQEILTMKESARRVKQALKKIDENNQLYYLYNKLIIIPPSYLRSYNVPNIESVSKEMVQITYLKLLSGKRHWNENLFPSLEKQFIASLTSETRNYCKKYSAEKHRILYDSNPPNIKTLKTDRLPHHQRTPEQILLDKENNKRMSSFLNFLKEEDEEAYLITSCFHLEGIDPRETKLLAERLNVTTWTITNAKRRLHNLMIKFQLQHKGDLS